MEMKQPIPTRQSDTFLAWRYKAFRLFLGARFVYTMAYQMQATVIGFYIYQLTHSKLAIALVGLSEVIPAIGLALYGGYITDRAEKRKLLLAVFGGVLCLTVLLLGITLGGMNTYWSPSAGLIMVYALLFGGGIARAFFEPVTFAISAESVPRAVYPNASIWNNSCWQAASIVGPAVSGFIYAQAPRLLNGLPGISSTCIVMVGLLLMGLLLAYWLPTYPPAGDQPIAMWPSFVAGLRFVKNHPMMLSTMSLDLVSVFFGGVTALLPIYALDILQVGAEGLGLMRTAFALGATLTMIGLVFVSPLNKPWRNLLLAVTGFGCSVIGFGLSDEFALSLLFLFLQGGFDSISVAIRSTILQLLTPDSMRGRISAVNTLFIGSSSEIGDVESGLAARLLGTIPAVVVGGSLTLMVVLFTYLKTRKLLLLTVDDLRPVKSSQSQP